MARTDALTAFPSAGAVPVDGFQPHRQGDHHAAKSDSSRAEESRIVGRIETFTLFHDIVIVPADPSDAENAPDYRVHDHDPGVRDIGPEIGAGWKRTGEKAGEYIALVIDDPAWRSRSAPTYSVTTMPAAPGRCTGRVNAIAARRSE